MGDRQADVTEGAEIVGALGRSLDDVGVVSEVTNRSDLRAGPGVIIPAREIGLLLSFDEARKLIDVLEDRARG